MGFIIIFSYMYIMYFNHDYPFNLLNPSQLH